MYVYVYANNDENTKKTKTILRKTLQSVKVFYLTISKQNIVRIIHIMADDELEGDAILYLEAVNYSCKYCKKIKFDI